jgi:hypothetical protein
MIHSPVCTALPYNTLSLDNNTHGVDAEGTDSVGGAAISDVITISEHTAKVSKEWKYRDTMTAQVGIKSHSALSMRILVKSLSEKGSDPLRRGKKTNEIDSPPKGQTPFRIGSKS